jgi:hypothetical protein
MKREKLRCLLLRRKKNFFLYIYAVITWEKIYKRPSNYYSHWCRFTKGTPSNLSETTRSLKCDCSSTPAWSHKLVGPGRFHKVSSFARVARFALIPIHSRARAFNLHGRHRRSSALESVCCLLVLNSVTSTPQWIRQPEAAWFSRFRKEFSQWACHENVENGTMRESSVYY